jgi:hypothetical protein
MRPLYPHVRYPSAALALEKDAIDQRSRDLLDGRVHFRGSEVAWTGFSSHRRNVSLGSLAGISRPRRDVRFTLRHGQVDCASGRYFDAASAAHFAKGFS